MSHNVVRNCVRLSFCLSALLYLAGCGHDNPLAPGKGAILSDYLPQENLLQQYQFILVRSYQWHDYEEYNYHSISGVCNIQMTKGQDNSTAEELVADIAFEVELDSLDQQGNPFLYDRIITVQKAYSLSQTNRLYLSADSLWYVPADSAQSGSGARRPMLSYSADKGGTLIDLSPFLPPGWVITLPATPNNFAEVRGDTLIFLFAGNGAPYHNGTVKFLRGTGLLSIDDYSYDGGTLAGTTTRITYRRI